MKNLLPLLIGTLILNFSVFANEKSCMDLKDDVKTFCKSIESHCSYIENCLKRRDICFEEGQPKSQSECESANTCVKKISNKFDGYEKCEYYWSDSGNNDSVKCHVRKRILFSEDACPGRIHGVLNAIAYGLNSTVDSDFSCKSTKSKYEKIVKSCKNQIDKFQKKCVEFDDTKSIVENYMPAKCVYFSDFSKYPRGTFSYIDDSDEIVNVKRSKNKEVDSSNYPTNDSTDISR